MSYSISKTQGVQPIMSFMSILIIGLIIAIFVVENDNLILPIILFSFLFGALIAGFEIRRLIYGNRNKEVLETKAKLKNNEMKPNLARFVAELYEEDIPFDELEKTSKTIGHEK